MSFASSSKSFEPNFQSTKVDDLETSKYFRKEKSVPKLVLTQSEKSERLISKYFVKETPEKPVKVLEIMDISYGHGSGDHISPSRQNVGEQNVELPSVAPSTSRKTVKVQDKRKIAKRQQSKKNKKKSATTYEDLNQPEVHEKQVARFAAITERVRAYQEMDAELKKNHPELLLLNKICKYELKGLELTQIVLNRIEEQLKDQ